MALGLDVARSPRAPAERDVLERALAALVADRAVERVVDEQELHHRVLGLLDLVRGGDHDHAVLHRRRARGLELGHALDLDQAHAAGPHRLAELALITEVGDLDVALLGGVDQDGALLGLHLAAVDLEGDELLLWPGHQAGPGSEAAASSPAPKAAASSRSRAARACS